MTVNKASSNQFDLKSTQTANILNLRSESAAAQFPNHPTATNVMSKRVTCQRVKDSSMSQNRLKGATVQKT